MVETFRCQAHSLKVSDLEGKTLVETLGKTLTNVNASTLADKVSDVKSDSMVYTLPDTLTNIKAQTVGKNVRGVYAKAFLTHTS